MMLQLLIFDSLTFRRLTQKIIVQKIASRHSIQVITVEEQIRILVGINYVEVRPFYVVVVVDFNRSFLGVHVMLVSAK